MHGDFVARGLSAEAHGAWDAFLSASLADAREAFGERFETHFDSAPAWRFALPEASGAIAPSVDRAGRRFPLLLGAACPENSAANVAASCETLLHRALGEAMTIDALWEAVCATEFAPSDESAPHGWWLDGGAEAGIDPVSAARPPALIRTMLEVSEGFV